MTDAAHNPDDYCYRHPDRLSFVLCERCGRTICLECQTHVGGTVLCPDDARRSNVTMLPVNERPKKPPRVRRTSTLLARLRPDAPLVTYSILAILVVVFLIDTVTRGLLGEYMVVLSTNVLQQPWTLLTSMLYPGSILTLLFSGVNLYFIGRILEPRLGRSKFIVLYAVSGFGAAVFAFLLDGSSASAYGAIVGLIAALVVEARRIGANPIYLYITCAISAVLAIVFGSWQAFLGGFVAGGLVAAIYLFEGDDRRVKRARLLLILLGVVLVIAAFLRALLFLGA